MDVHVQSRYGLIVAAPTALERYALAVNRLGLIAVANPSATDATAALRASPPDIAILEVESGGCALLHELRDHYGMDLPVMLVSAKRTMPADVVAGLLVGADDYAAESMDGEEFLARARRLVERMHRPATLTVDLLRLAALTSREREVLAHIAAGESHKQVAAALGISVKTVGAHMQNMLGKLGLHSRVEAVMLLARVNAEAPAAVSLLSA